MIKTVQVSEAFWRRLKMVAAERGVTVRAVLEEVGEAFLGTHPVNVVEASIRAVALRGAAEALQANRPVLLSGAEAPARELVVELEEGDGEEEAGEGGRGAGGTGRRAAVSPSRVTACLSAAVGLVPTA